jgi:hypothetical protein
MKIVPYSSATPSGCFIPDWSLSVRDPQLTFSDLHIFKLWDITDTPGVLVGMDILGLVDTLVVDYCRKELHIRPARRKSEEP